MEIGTNTSAKAEYAGQISVFESPHNRDVLLVDIAEPDRYGRLEWCAVQHDDPAYDIALQGYASAKKTAKCAEDIRFADIDGRISVRELVRGIQDQAIVVERANECGDAGIIGAVAGLRGLLNAQESYAGENVPTQSLTTVLKTLDDMVLEIQGIRESVVQHFESVVNEPLFPWRASQSEWTRDSYAAVLERQMGGDNGLPTCDLTVLRDGSGDYFAAHGSVVMSDKPSQSINDAIAIAMKFHAEEWSVENGYLPENTILASEGIFAGNVVDVQGDYIVQDVGRGKLVAHDRMQFVSTPHIGSSLDIQYKGQKPNVIEPKGKDKGVTR